MEYLGFELCSDEELMEYYMGGLQKECDKRNMTIEEYMIDYLLTNHGHEFWMHLDDLIFKQGFEDSGADQEDDDRYDYWADEADRLLDEYDAIQEAMNAATE